ncbi:Protein of unknown function [Rhizobium sp. NFR07]|uniref:DUF982 domain-containing protein n=1 Tax=Rhizobium sp. NFR07 TaxID=1566262 RepID=UPI0008E802E6|nr:DUF982 domain-containing protein [Rhizobium sp. NFR07]SFB60821.1 Protein of unknown function [Rhizobium sp. NFR07]
MATGDWEKPVIIALPGFAHREVAGPFEALALLNEGWPTMAGAPFIKAKVACRAALEDRITPEQARRDFERAAREASRFQR